MSDIRKFVDLSSFSATIWNFIENNISYSIYLVFVLCNRFILLFMCVIKRINSQSIYLTKLKFIAFMQKLKLNNIDEIRSHFTFSVVLQQFFL